MRKLRLFSILVMFISLFCSPIWADSCDYSYIMGNVVSGNTPVEGIPVYLCPALEDTEVCLSSPLDMVYTDFDGTFIFENVYDKTEDNYYKVVFPGDEEYNLAEVTTNVNGDPILLSPSTCVFEDVRIVLTKKVSGVGGGGGGAVPPPPSPEEVAEQTAQKIEQATSTEEVRNAFSEGLSTVLETSTQEELVENVAKFVEDIIDDVAEKSPEVVDDVIADTVDNVLSKVEVQQTEEATKIVQKIVESSAKSLVDNLKEKPEVLKEAISNLAVGAVKAEKAPPKTKEVAVYVVAVTVVKTETLTSEVKVEVLKEVLTKLISALSGTGTFSAESENSTASVPEIVDEVVVASIKGGLYKDIDPILSVLDENGMDLQLTDELSINGSVNASSVVDIANVALSNLEVGEVSGAIGDSLQISLVGAKALVRVNEVGYSHKYKETTVSEDGLSIDLNDSKGLWIKIVPKPIDLDGLKRTFESYGLEFDYDDDYGLVQVVDEDRGKIYTAVVGWVAVGEGEFGSLDVTNPFGVYGDSPSSVEFRIRANFDNGSLTQDLAPAVYKLKELEDWLAKYKWELVVDRTTGLLTAISPDGNKFCFKPSYEVDYEDIENVSDIGGNEFSIELKDANGDGNMDVLLRTENSSQLLYSVTCP